MALAVVGALVAAIAPVETAAAATAPLAVTVPATVLVLPAADGFHDSTSVRVMAGKGWAVDVVAVRGTRTVTIRKRVALKPVRPGFYAADVRVGVGLVTAGSWKVQARRSAHPSTRATAARTLRVGSGVARSVGLRSSVTTLYPYRDGYRERAVVTVTARDETGTGLPFAGAVRAVSHGKTRAIALRSSTGRATGTLSLAGLPTGIGAVTASARGPAGATHLSAPLRLTLRTTGVSTVRLRPSLAELQPVVDGRADAMTISVSSTTTTGKAYAATGTLAVVGPAGTVASWPLTTTRTTKVTWDGRVKGVIAAGDYTLRATLKGPQGTARTATASLAVTKTHLPFRVRTLYELPVASGNQQGLAESGNTVYVTADLGGGTTRIDLLDRETGTLIRSIGPLPLGHGAEVSVGSNGLLYVANGGGATLTKVFAVDPAAGRIVKTFDLASLGTSGLVAFDAANERLLVFTGKPGAYRVTPVDLAGAIGTSVPLKDQGVPQGLEVVGAELWLYTTVESGSRISRFDPATGALLGIIELALTGEAEGLAYDASRDEVLVGAHSPSRVGILEPVPDE